MNTTTQELARAWRRYFSSQESPRLSPEVNSVVIVEDLTKGPYPPARLFQVGGSDNPAAGLGQYSVEILKNTGGRGSVVVVERLRVRGFGTQFLIGVHTESFGTASNVGSKIALDRAPEALAKSYNAGQLFIGDVQLFHNKSGTAVGWDSVPVNGLVAGAAREYFAELEGPWIIGQGGEMAVHSGDQNTGILCYFVGRYYTLS